MREAIEEGNKQWSAALSRGDSAGMAALYTPNAPLFPTYSDIVNGTEAIRKFWQGVIILDVDGQGDPAYEVGQYALTGEGGKVLDNGKYIVVWKREQGK